MIINSDRRFKSQSSILESIKSNKDTFTIESVLEGVDSRVTNGLKNFFKNSNVSATVSKKVRDILNDIYKACERIKMESGNDYSFKNARSEYNKGSYTAGDDINNDSIDLPFYSYIFDIEFDGVNTQGALERIVDVIRKTGWKVQDDYGVYTVGSIGRYDTDNVEVSMEVSSKRTISVSLWKQVSL